MSIFITIKFNKYQIYDFVCQLLHCHHFQQRFQNNQIFFSQIYVIFDKFQFEPMKSQSNYPYFLLFQTEDKICKIFAICYQLQILNKHTYNGFVKFKINQKKKRWKDMSIVLAKSKQSTTKICYKGEPKAWVSYNFRDNFHQRRYSEIMLRLLRINADNQDKRNICIFWTVFISVIIAISITSAFLPQEILKTTNSQQLRGSSLEGCNNPNRLDSNGVVLCTANSTTNKMAGIMLNLIRENQFAVLIWRVMLVDNKRIMQAFPLTVNATSYYLKQTTKNGKTYQKSDQKFLPNQTLTLQFTNSLRIVGDDDKTVIGYSQPVSAIRNIRQQSRLIIIEMDRNITDIPNVSDIRAQILVVNPQFTKYSIIIRYLFFASSLVACVLYVVMYRKIPVAERILEQKLILMLSVLLIFFNDPFYPITILMPNKASSYFSVFFVINFTLFLVFFWIIFVDRMLYENGQKQTQLFTWTRILYIAVTYGLVLIVYTLIAMDFQEGFPIIRAEEIVSGKYVVLEVFALLFLVAGFIYIFVNYVRLCVKADQMLWRNQLFLFFSVFFIVMTISLFFVNGYEINHMSGNRILLVFTMMNMYTFYMQYMYSISKQQSQRVRRGQVEHGGVGLLEVKSGDGDCVDLDFDDMIIGNKIGSDNKLVDFTNKNKKENLKGQNSEIEQQIYSPKYGQDYGQDLKGPAIKEKMEKEEKIDFFGQKGYESELKEKQNKQGDNFAEFSLDD